MNSLNRDMKDKKITPITIRIDYPQGSIARQITSNKKWLVKLIEFIEKEDSGESVDLLKVAKE